MKKHIFASIVWVPMVWIPVAGWSASAPDRELLIEEIVVTAQRVEENAQDVPIAMTAFSEADIVDRHIVGLTNLQLFAPNVIYSEENYGAPIASIRGVGRLSSTAELSPVSFHINDVPQRFAPHTEFYDIERLEVLRGPQGTLFGRNSTAGTINIITKRPRLEGSEGYVELEAGNYDLQRIRAAGEVTLAHNFGVRIAGLMLDRDGYIKNLADGDVPEVDDDMDGRDVHSFRITPRWEISERTTIWGMFERIREDDDRVRISNQVCKAPDLAVLGCDPDAFGLEAVNHAATEFGVVAALSGMIDFGARNAATGLNFDLPRPNVGLREQHTDFEPVFELDVDHWILGVDHAFDSADLSVLAGYRERTYFSTQDEFMDVGFTLNPTVFNPSGLWPTSLPPSPGNPLGGPCPALDGLAGVHGGCVSSTNQTRFFSFNQIDADERWLTLEAKLASTGEGRFSWLVGAQYQDSEVEGALYRPNNVNDSTGVFGIPNIGLPPVYTLLNGFAETQKLDSYAVFGEAYWEVTDSLTLTLGLRYTDDKVTNRGTPFAFTSLDVGGDWMRFEFFNWILSGTPDEGALALTDYYGLTDAAINATSFDELLGVLRQAPPIRTPGEAKGVLGIPDTHSVDYVTGRIGLDWQIAPNSLLYAFYDRGKKPGSPNAINPLNPFDDETVDAIEIGAKTLLFDSSLLLNLAAFHNAYGGLQYKLTEEEVTNNVDADVWGIEVEARWRPTVNLDVAFSYGYLNTKVEDFQDLDLLDVARGTPGLVTLKDLDIARPATNFVATRSEVLTITPQATNDGGAIPAPGAIYDDGIPVYFSRSYLEANGISTSDGVPVDLDGKELPSAPPHQVSLGVAYTWFLDFGALTARWDYYWQDRMYARYFNRPGDEIDSWSQQNASIAFTSANGRWTAKAWVNNITDEDNVTGQFVENENQGGFRNYFLTAPRVYGASLRYNFGTD